MISSISGADSVVEHGEFVHSGDVRAQAWRMFQNIQGLFESEGADWHDVVPLTCHLADFRDDDAFNEVRYACF